MKTPFRILTLLAGILTLATAIYALVRLFSHDEDDPYYYYGDSMYRGEHGDPIRYETDEEKSEREEAKVEEPVVPEGYAHMVH